MIHILANLPPKINHSKPGNFVLLTTSVIYWILWIREFLKDLLINSFSYVSPLSILSTHILKDYCGGCNVFISLFIIGSIKTCPSMSIQLPLNVGVLLQFLCPRFRVLFCSLWRLPFDKLFTILPTPQTPRSCSFWYWPMLTYWLFVVG